MPLDPERVQALFLAAAELADPAERDAFLDRKCENDLDLRQRVSPLLKAHDDPGNLPVAGDLTGPFQPEPAAPRGGLAAGQVFGGRYKLREKLGQGGMGEVWVADQTEPVKRRIALKVIKTGLDSARLLARFEQERQALALMDHPNIAKVLDAGVGDDGQPYFVMELVKGLSLTKYCDAAKMSPRERLELFIPVCRAVQHAHQKGIIHRDLKPSNILIGLYDGQPVPKVIDFGIAKATGPRLTEQSIYTEVGSLVGTLEYMSPEQAELNNLDIDTRADIYSLGVLLYELLTGSPPFTRLQLRSAAFTEMLRIIREVEPPKPSTKLSGSGELPSIAANRHLEPKKLTKLVTGELDWIVMKCLEKERSRRYETANGLGMDLQRYLADEPVVAGPPSAGYRLRKFARRHKASLWAAAALIGVMLLIGSGAGWMIWDRAARRAGTAQAVTHALGRAEELSDRVGRMTVESSKEADAALVLWQQALDALGEADAALRAGVAIERLADQVERSRDRILGGQAGTRQRRARALRRERLFRDLDVARMALAAWTDSHFDHAGAAAKFAAAFAAFDCKVQPGPIEELARQIREEEPAIREALIGGLDFWHYCAPPPLKATLLAIARAADDDAWRGDYREAVAARDQARLVRLSKEARSRSLPPTSIQLLAYALRDNQHVKEALDLLRSARGKYPADFWIAFDLGKCNRSLHLAQGKDPDPVDLEEEIGSDRVAVALRPDASVAHNNLGVALADKKLWNEALAEFDEAVKLDLRHAIAHDNRGIVLKAMHRPEEALAAFKKANELDPNFAPDLGKFLADQHQLDNAITEYKQAIALDARNAQAHYDLGVALLEKKQLKGALAEFDTAIAIDPAYAVAKRKLSAACNAFGLALKAENELDGAMAEYQKAVALDAKNVAARGNLGNILLRRNQVDEAIAEFQTAIAIDAGYAPVHVNLARALVRKNREDQAIAECKQAIAIDPNNPVAHYNLGHLFFGKQRWDEAIAQLEMAVAINPKNADYQGLLGQALLQKGRFQEAKTSIQQALHLLPEAHPQRAFVSQQLQQCEALLALAGNIQGVLAGKTKPVDTREYVGLIAVCRLQQQYAAAAKLSADAFAADPALAADMQAAHRYNAACFAALAAAGKGIDAGKLNAAEPARLRKKAVAWLRADLAYWRKQLASREQVRKTLRHWQQDADLAGIRDPAALTEVPPDERELCERLWADVAELAQGR